jgi:hypothetical protein
MPFPHFQALLDGAMELRRQETFTAITAASFPYMKEADQKRVAAELEGRAGPRREESAATSAPEGWGRLRAWVMMDAARYPGVVLEKLPPPRAALEPSPEE